MTEPEIPQPRSRVREWFGSPKLVWWVLLAAILIALPTLDVGLLGDDLPQAEFLLAQREGSSAAPWWDMFVLVSGPRAHNEALRELGERPWWVDLDLRVAFFRPLSVATHLLDVWLWPDAAWAMHLHSMIWYALACVLVWVLARRLCSTACAAGLASLVYVGAFGHLIPVGWIAHRNGVISTVCALLAILAHDRWRVEGDKLGAVLAPLALVAALLAGEAGVVTLAFIVAHALLRDRGTRRERVLAVVPSLVVIVVWRMLVDALGYGVEGSGAYVDPLANPGEFLAVWPGRYVALLVFCVAPPFSTDVSAPLLWWLAALVLIGAVVVFVVRHDRGAARLGALAAALGCVPLAASVPFERLLVLTSFGMALVWGELLDTWVLGRGQTITARGIGVFVATVHLLVSPAAFVWHGQALDAMRPSAALFDEDAWSRMPGNTVVLLHTPNVLVVEFLEHTLRAEGLPTPVRVWTLHAGVEPPMFEQIDDYTLELRSPLGWPADTVTGFWRSPSRAPFVVGDRIVTRDFTAVVEDVAAGKATRVRFRFARRLDDPGQVWLLWNDGQHRGVNPVIW